MQLVSKLQYKNCEPGEFFDSAMRSLDETIALIEQFPWSIHREHTPVQLTCPSVTIEHTNGSFLKLGPFYNGKFTLYLLQKSGKVLQRIFPDLDESVLVIKDYFAVKDISSGFREMHFVSLHKKHFVTARFEYVLTGARILQFLFFPEIFFLVYFGLIIAAASRGGSHQLEGILLGIGLMALITGPNWVLFLNYYKYSKDQYLRMSNSHQKFLFGTKDNFQEYDKMEIEKVIIYMSKSTRSQVHGYCIYELRFLNGDSIKFTSLLLNEYQFRGKIHGKQIEEVHEMFPSI